MSAATPGPWRAGLGSVWTTPGEQLICSEVSCQDDAALIAAAPLMVSVLRDIAKLPIPVVEAASEGRQSVDWLKIAKWMQEKAEGALIVAEASK